MVFAWDAGDERRLDSFRSNPQRPRNLSALSSHLVPHAFARTVRVSRTLDVRNERSAFVRVSEPEGMNLGSTQDTLGP